MKVIELDMYQATAVAAIVLYWGVSLLTRLRFCVSIVFRRR